MKRLIPLTLLSLSLGAPIVGSAATPRAATGVTKAKSATKKKKVGAKRVKKNAPAPTASLPNS